MSRIWQRARTSFFWMVIIALAIRILVIWLFHTYRFGPGEPYRFGYEMGRIGRSIAQGNGFGNIYGGQTGPTSWEPPLYPYIVGGIFKLFGVYTRRSAFVLLAINSVFSAFTCIPIFLIATRCFGKRAAIGSAWTWALYPLSIYWAATWVWETVVSTLLLTIVFWLTLTMEERTGVRPWIWFGLLWGITVLSNPALVSFLPASGLWILFRYSKRNRPWLAREVVASLVFLACLLPWQVRNYRTFGHFFFVRGDFGMTLRMGNGPEARGDWLTDLIPSRNRNEFERYASMGETSYAAAQKREAIQFIEENPGRFAVLCIKRILYYWAGNPRASILQPSTFVNLLEIAAALICFWGLTHALCNRVPGTWLFFWLIVLFPLVYYITYPNIRYREPLDPFTIMLGVFLITDQKASRRTTTENCLCNVST